MKSTTTNGPFGLAGSEWEHSCITRKEDWNAYALGFLRAANSLVDQLMTTRQHLDTMVYPVLFLHRHYLELRLKELIRVGSQVIGEPRRPPNRHELTPLWRDVRVIIERTWPDVPNAVDFTR